MHLSIGFSPCPNDTFMMDALLHHKVDTEGLSFEPYITDIEKLNQNALRKELDITKLSYHAYVHVADDYILLSAGSALGNNCGPLLITTPENLKTDVNQLQIAIPGYYTTAHFLLTIAFPQAKNKTEMLFSAIEHAIVNEDVDAGVIIHENRFTYQQKGLKKIMDLGEYWENTTHLPIPLGGFAIRRDLAKDIQHKVNRIVEQSIKYAFQHPESGKDFVKKHASEMDEEVIQKHIQLYVNQYSVLLGQKGKQAVSLFFEKAIENGFVHHVKKPCFL